MDTICGVDCASCAFREACSGCVATQGHPFGDSCILADCCKSKGQDRCAQCGEVCALKSRLMQQFNALGIEDMEEITGLYALKGSIVNLEYPLPGGRKVRFWPDNRVLLGSQVEKKGSGRCYGLAADEHFLMVSEYGENGADPRIVIFKCCNPPFDGAQKR